MGTNVEVRSVDLANWTSGLRRNSPQRLNVSSIRVFDHIRDPEIPIILRRPPPTLRLGSIKQQQKLVIYIFILLI